MLVKERRYSLTSLGAEQMGKNKHVRKWIEQEMRLSKISQISERYGSFTLVWNLDFKIYVRIWGETIKWSNL